MPTVDPFRGVRYTNADSLKDLVCPPYDIISPAEQQELHDRSAHNAVRLELAKDRGPAGYAAVRDLYDGWLEQEVLRTDEELCFYLYRQDFTAPSRARGTVTGVIGALHVEEFGHDAGVLPHERTMPGPIEDRLALLDAVQVNISPIYSIYRGKGTLSPLFETVSERPPIARFQDAAGVLHRMWLIGSPAEKGTIGDFLSDQTLVIADGHHRYETALRYHRMQQKDGPHGSIMCLCVDADAADLVVLPYHRALKLNDPAEATTSLRDASAGTDKDGTDNPGTHPFTFLHGSEEYPVEIHDDEVAVVVGERARAWRDLDVVALHEALLPRLFPAGVRELSFSKDAEHIRALVENEGWDVGVLLRALSAAQIVDVARSGERMPQKASYFWPKAITGLVFRPLR